MNKGLRGITILAAILMFQGLAFAAFPELAQYRLFRASFAFYGFSILGASIHIRDHME